MGEDRRGRRVDASREVVGHQSVDPLGEPVGDVAVGQHLIVRDEHEQLDSSLLEPDPAGERAEVMTKVQRPGRPVAGGDPKPRRVCGDQGFELSALHGTLLLA